MLAIARAKLQQRSESARHVVRSASNRCHTDLTAKLVPILTLPGQCHHHADRLTYKRSHSFAFRLDQMRKVSIDVANQRHPGLFDDLIYTRRIEVMLRSESGSQQKLFSVAPGDRDREIVMLKSGRYLLELRTKTSQKLDYALKLTAMKWFVLEFA